LKEVINKRDHTPHLGYENFTSSLSWKVPLGAYALYWESMGKRLHGIKRKSEL